ncbi:Maf family protein [Pirellulaceae bacterium]|nr:Maf family protein [Pirellulaceae bacterium]MDB4640032.1 Maf family protein [Pirellulaceae bacterium]
MSFKKDTSRLILASGSPRRKQLLKAANYLFDVVQPDDSAEDGACSGETPAELVARLAYQKAENVAKKFDDGLYLGCDTVGEINGQILGKPQDEAHAEKMLRLMSGREHRVFSGVCLWNRPDNKKLVKVAATQLKMEPLSEAWLKDYLATDSWIGKAGAFGFQDGLDWINIIDGSESNVVGLPMELLEEMLQEF